VHNDTAQSPKPPIMGMVLGAQPTLTVGTTYAWTGRRSTMFADVAADDQPAGSTTAPVTGGTLSFVANHYQGPPAVGGGTVQSWDHTMPARTNTARRPFVRGARTTRVSRTATAQRATSGPRRSKATAATSNRADGGGDEPGEADGPGDRPEGRHRVERRRLGDLLHVHEYLVPLLERLAGAR
jgi:hypothetical protein